MATLLHNQVFRRLYLAQVVSLGGTGLLTVALGLLAYDLAGADAATVLGTALAIKMVAYVAMAPIMRVALARYSATRVLIGADVVRVAMAACLPWVHHTWQIYLLIFALQTAAATFTPTFSAAMTRVVTDERQYTTAVSASRAAYDGESLVSPLLAAALLTVVEYSQLFVFTAIGFVVSALLVCVSGLRRIDAGYIRGDTSSPLPRRLTSGIRIMFASNALRAVLAVNIAIAAGTSVVLVNTVVYVRADSDAGEVVVAVALASFGAGSLLATIAVPALIRRVGIRAVTTGGACLIAVTLVGTATWLTVTTRPEVVSATWLVLGVATSLVGTTLPRLIRDHTDLGARDDVFTAQFSASHAAFLLTYIVAGWAPRALGQPVTVALLALLAAASAAAARHALYNGSAYNGSAYNGSEHNGSAYNGSARGSAPTHSVVRTSPTMTSAAARQL